MKHFTLLFLSTILLLLSCTKEDPGEKEVIKYTISDLEQYGYFPLHVGNEWDFISGDKIRTDMMVTIDGQEYFSFVKKSNIKYPTYYRQEGNFIFEKEGDQPEILRYDLGANVNGTWIFEDPSNSVLIYKATMITKTSIVQTENHQFEKCYEYLYEVPGISHTQDQLFLAKGIGYFKSRSGSLWNDRGLLRVKIDGKEVIF